MKKWLSIHASLVVILITTSASAQESVRYIHTDPLGSVVAVSDESGRVIERRTYEPYGRQQGPVEGGPGFTGHVQDDGTGLIYMQQRYQDPETGRFLSIDPVSSESGNAQHFNRYAYAYNNP